MTDRKVIEVISRQKRVDLTALGVTLKHGSIREQTQLQVKEVISRFGG
jgi:hypothetical protein